MSRRSYRSSRRVLAGFVFAIVAAVLTSPRAQGTGPTGLVVSRSVNMVSGDTWPNGDPFLQRQNEPSVAASTRNPLHLLAGANDYRTVDLPDLSTGEETGDAWFAYRQRPVVQAGLGAVVGERHCGDCSAVAPQRP